MSLTRSKRRRLLPVIFAFNLTALSPILANAASVDLFFSEYIEGSSYNKALEIYNPLSTTVNLESENIQVALYINGATTPRSTIALSGLLNPNEVFVLSHSRANQAIQDLSQLTTGNLNFNGDDAIVLFRDNEILDVIGQVGINPEIAWENGTVSTKDNTLQRLSHILIGDKIGNNPFNPSLEWQSLEINNISGLGSHTLVTAVPIPAALPFFLSGIIGLIGIARGKRKK